jgi:hypothetical protein
MDWDGDISLHAEQAVPTEAFEEVCNHIRAHKLKWHELGRRRRRFEKMYKRPAKGIWYEKPE